MSGLHEERPGRDRLLRALSGVAGPPCVGVTFVPDEAITSLAWGEGSPEPLLSLVCSRLRPDFVFVRSWAPDAASTCAAVIACGAAALWVVRGPFDSAAASLGWTEALRATIADPGALSLRLDEAVGSGLARIREGLACGAAGIVVAEDVAGADGPMLAPDYTLAEIVPRLGRLAAGAAGEGLPSVWHSDGDVRPFLKAAARQGIDAIHPGGLVIERFGDVYAAARQAGLSVLGGLPGEVLRGGGPAVIRTATEAALVARTGGLLVADDGGISSGEELGMLVVALQTAREPGPGDEA